MKTYDEKTLEEIQNPDLEKGYIYQVRRQIGTERRTHKGTEALYPPNGLQYDVLVYEDCQLYHAYTEEELAAQKESIQPSNLDTRVAALEEELRAAKILLGVE